MKYYFYNNKTKIINNDMFYTVYAIDVKDNYIYIAENKCKTIARKRKDKLAGGYFTEKGKPYNFKTNYKVIKVPMNTKEYVDKKYNIIDNIIAFETGELSQDKILELFSQLIKNGMAWSLQGSYGRQAQSLIENSYISENGKILKTIREA